MSDTADLLDRCRNALDKAVTALEWAQSKVIERLENAEQYDQKLGSHLAWTAAKVAEITTSIRQLEKHDRTMVKSPTQRFGLVKEFLRGEATPIQRAEIMAMLGELVEQRSVLS